MHTLECSSALIPIPTQYQVKHQVPLSIIMLYFTWSLFATGMALPVLHTSLEEKLPVSYAQNRNPEDTGSPRTIELVTSLLCVYACYIPHNVTVSIPEISESKLYLWSKSKSISLWVVSLQ